jgi:glycosyltransferase involved in cell wall biosynthesis
MSAPLVALFSTYRPSQSFGGPARILREREALEDGGVNVAHIVVQSSHASGETRPLDLNLVIPPRRDDFIDPLYSDLDLGRSAASTSSICRKVIAHLYRHRAQIVIVEQPFLIELGQIVADALGIGVIYSSQNIEHSLRHDLERFEPSAKRLEGRSEEVRALEALATSSSQAITTICKTDQVRLANEFGRNSTVVPNGSSLADLPRDRSTMKRRPVPRYFAFAGSAYWPNTEGFVEIAYPSLAFLPPSVTIEVSGTVSDRILSHHRLRQSHSVNAARLNPRGFLPLEDLSSLLFHSSAVLVPIFTGEGSNLKSADALASGSHSIMTRRSTHGYEDVIAADSHGVHVVDSPEEFRSAMQRLIDEGSSADLLGEERRSMLRWNTRLEPLVNLVRSLL